MRKIRSIVLLVLVAALACFTFTGCGEETSSQREAEALEEVESQNLTDIADYTQRIANLMTANSYEMYESYVSSGQTVLNMLVDNDLGVRWKEFVDLHGEVVNAEVDLTQKDDYNYTSRIILTGEDGQQMALTVTYNEASEPIETTIADYSDDSQLSLGSKMATAGSNTITGLLVVFVILVGLSLIISCFRFIGKAEKKPENKDQTATAAPAVKAAPAPANTAAEPDLMKDQELVAVLAAAIAAYEDKPVEGYTVRSIRRLKSNKWR